jgi:peptide/nickel transport system permease protein
MFSTTTSQIRDSRLVLYLKSHPIQAFGFVVSIISIILAIIGPYIVPHSPTLGVPGKHLLPPSYEYWFGTDVNGMCIFSRTIAAYRTDLVIAVVGALMALFIGAPLGIIAGYFDGKSGFWGSISLVILRIMDVIQAFPVFVLGLLLVAAFGPSPQNLIFMIAVANIPGNLRLARSEAISLREKDFVEAARAVGNSELRIAFHHIMPNAITPVIALLSVVMGFGILLTAGLSFVGAGVRVPTPEWGSMIASGGTTMITGQWWPSFFPGLFMALTIFGFSMLGEIITVLIDPLERIKLHSGSDIQR